jgi:hypothetical protein
MQLNDASLLRTRLRQVNVAYSALVRNKAGEARFVRMAELRAERDALMALLAGRGDASLSKAAEEQSRKAARPTERAEGVTHRPHRSEVAA